VSRGRGRSRFAWGWAAIVVVVVVVGCSAGPESDARALLRRAGSVSYPDRFTLVDRPDAPGLQRCFTDEVPVTVAVDRVVGVAAVRGPGGATVAIVSPGVAWVDAATATDGVLVGWIEVRAEDPVEVRDLVLQAVGPSVAGYVGGFELPVSPAVTAAGVRESATSVELRDDGSVRAVIDRLALIDDDAEDDGGEELGFTADFVFDDAGRVVRVSARPSVDSEASTDEAESFGYVLDYDWSAGTEIEVPNPAMVTPVGEAIDEVVVPIRSAFECSIGG
jgi:hypothetical protein